MFPKKSGTVEGPADGWERGKAEGEKPPRFKRVGAPRKKNKNVVGTGNGEKPANLKRTRNSDGVRDL